jgi:hypothetical protein
MHDRSHRAGANGRRGNGRRGRFRAAGARAPARRAPGATGRQPPPRSGARPPSLLPAILTTALALGALLWIVPGAEGDAPAALPAVAMPAR